VIQSVGQERQRIQSNIIRKEMVNVDSDDEDEDDDMDMDMSENPTGNKMINYIGNEKTPTANRIKKLP